MQLKNRFSNMIPKIMEEFEYQKLSISDNLEFFKRALDEEVRKSNFETY